MESRIIEAIRDVKNGSEPLNQSFGQPESEGCPDGWLDSNSLKLGCLYFHGQSRMTWNDASKYCQSQGSHLIEIFNETQLEFIQMKLKVGQYYSCFVLEMFYTFYNPGGV